ncbi:MAG: 4-hydroxythreonine-4-phosphate dehydrogenase PdxA [Planctomycetota bacterium]
MTLAVTMGDPRGIGPEIALEATKSPDLPEQVRILIVGSMDLLRAEAQNLGLHVDLRPFDGFAWSQTAAAVLDMANFPPDQLEPRRPDALSGNASLEYIETAVELATEGTVDAIVTGPISKEAIGAALSPFPGHTEMLAELTGAERAVMLLVNEALRVALVTTHLALRDVSEALREEDITETAVVLADGLRRFFGIDEPRLAVCGLNPHCGDGGRFGDEEDRIVRPAVERAQEAGVDLQGPRSADTVFAEAVKGDYDAVIALYHDQGMIPVKLQGVERVVNVTLGLPIVRTSVGHGTAYDIAGQGIADEQSLVEAIRLAADMARPSGPNSAGGR